MPIPRKYLVDSESAGFYHCTSRCVRRAFLCGEDPVTGQNFDHRKAWIEKRMLELSEIFSVSLYAYAVMNNHYHVVLKTDPKKPQNWTDEEVAERWLLAYPGRLGRTENSEQREQKKQSLINNSKKLHKYRKRLGSLSWFMSRLNEPLAKQSNLEDSVKGKFWESRYESIPLLDETAVLACMAYVDLNPIRAGITQRLEESFYTSIQKRIKMALVFSATLSHPLMPINSSKDDSLRCLNLKDYLELIEFTGKAIVHPDKASIPIHISSILIRLNLQNDNWLNQIQKLCHDKPTVIGSMEKLKERARKLGQKWTKGMRQSRFLYRS